MNESFYNINFHLKKFPQTLFLLLVLLDNQFMRLATKAMRCLLLNNTIINDLPLTTDISMLLMLSIITNNIEGTISVHWMNTILNIDKLNSRMSVFSPVMLLHKAYKIFQSKDYILVFHSIK